MQAARVQVASMLVVLATLGFFAPHAAAQGQGAVPSGGTSCGLVRITDGPTAPPPAQPGLAAPARDLRSFWFRVRMLPARLPGWGLVIVDPVFACDRRRTPR
jgi:hypothetical protein